MYNEELEEYAPPWDEEGHPIVPIDTTKGFVPTRDELLVLARYLMEREAALVQLATTQEEIAEDFIMVGQLRSRLAHIAVLIGIDLLDDMYVQVNRKYFKPELSSPSDGQERGTDRG